MFNFIKKYLCLILLTICTAILILITSFALMQVCGRYIFEYTFFWVEEITSILLSWLVALGVPLIWLKGSHITMDAIDNWLSEDSKKIFDIIINLIAFGVGIIFTLAGIKAIHINSGFSISMLRYDESVKYYHIPVMGILLSLSSIITLFSPVKRSNGEAIE